MTVNVTALPEQAAAPQPVRPNAQLPISAAGVNDLAAVARQQLPGAVPATALIPAYAAHVAAPPKPPLRQPASGPSSAFAAQFLAQSPEVSAEDMAILTPRPPANAEAQAAPEDDYLTNMRIARGDIQPRAQEVTAAPTTTKQPMATGETATRSPLLQMAAGLPSLFTQFIKRPTILQARGIGAYQLAEARNASMRKSVETVSAP